MMGRVCGGFWRCRPGFGVSGAHALDVDSLFAGADVDGIQETRFEGVVVALGCLGVEGLVFRRFLDVD